MKKLILPLATASAVAILVLPSLYSKRASYRGTSPSPTVAMPVERQALRDAPGPIRAAGNDGLGIDFEGNSNSSIQERIQNIPQGEIGASPAEVPTLAKPPALTAVPASSDAAGSTVLSLDKTIQLSRFQGYTYLQAMMASDGIKASLDADEQTAFTVASKEQILEKAKTLFAPKVFGKLVSLFKDGESGFGNLIDALAGSQATPATVAGKIAKQLDAQQLLADPSKVGLAAVMLAPLVSLASGSGTLVQIDRDNLFYNVGYKPGSSDPNEVEMDVKSGRSFGASPGHPALDASDLDYLGELGAYLQNISDPTDFYQTLFQALLRCDPAGWTGLSRDGQATATDFLAIYTAELDRHLMTGLTEHAWQNDLAEVTLLSAYGVRAGLVEKGGRLVPGTPKDYFGLGQSGSGIGETRKDRKALQSAVTDAERKLHPDVVSAVERLIGVSGGDVIHGLMVYLDNPSNQQSIQQNAPALARAIAGFAAQIQADAEAVTEQIQK